MPAAYLEWQIVTVCQMREFTLHALKNPQPATVHRESARHQLPLTGRWSTEKSLCTQQHMLCRHTHDTSKQHPNVSPQHQAQPAACTTPPPPPPPHTHNSITALHTNRTWKQHTPQTPNSKQSWWCSRPPPASRTCMLCCAPSARPSSML